MDCRSCEYGSNCEHITPCVKDSYTVITDYDRINWLERMMFGKDDYCEIYLAGLRCGPADATAYQVESQPERFKTVNAPTLREAIDRAILATRTLKEG